MPSTIAITHEGPVVHVQLNRPDVRNAFDEHLIDELTTWAAAAPASGARVAILSGAGKVFSAGADLAWMSRMVSASREENVEDARNMARMFHALDTVPMPLIGRVHGAALGGGVGLAAVCDIVVSADDAVFGLTEAKLGILPAVVGPFVLAKVGRSAARELFLTAGRFSADRARVIGLVHAVVPERDLDTTLDAYVHQLLTSAPEAMASAKALIAHVYGRPSADVLEFTAETIARHRVSSEGQAGMRAFLEKRKAPWVPQ
ncbi:MAG: enoyl-CoA hydratase/isomerase family protein [Acidobacteria bacterium]|nr:enoyl-CoA hydratase/isomerase family protein [Acidobacteriota bacterium]